MALYGNQSAMGSSSAASGAGALTKGPDLEVIQTEVCSDPPFLFFPFPVPETSIVASA